MRDKRSAPMAGATSQGRYPPTGALSGGGLAITDCRNSSRINDTQHLGSSPPLQIHTKNCKSALDAAHARGGRMGHEPVAVIRSKPAEHPSETTLHGRPGKAPAGSQRARQLSAEEKNPSGLIEMPQRQRKSFAAGFPAFPEGGQGFSRRERGEMRNTPA